MATTGVKFHPLPRRLEGKEFLVSSHFHIGCDGRLASDPRSTFTSDFPPRDPRLSKRNPMSEPDPAHIMHSDAGDRVSGKSEARDTFSKHDVGRPEFKSATTGYRTNFKMHSDDSIVRKFNFRTSHLEEFRTPDLLEARRTMNEALSSMRSYLPGGDRGKEKSTSSEYGSSFRGDRGTIAVATQSRWNEPETIRGSYTCVTTCFKFNHKIASVN